MKSEFSVQLATGETLKGLYFPAEEPKVNFVFITGMQEYSGRYEGMAEWMNKKGINVWVLDHFGQGLNAPKPEEQMRWPKGGFYKTVEGLHLVIELAKKNGLPTVQGGHSMGSFMTQARLEQYPGDTKGTLIIGSNGGQAFLMKAAHILAKMRASDKKWNEPDPMMANLGMGGYAKAVKDRKTDLDWLSYEEENVRKYIADPYCGAMTTRGFWREFTDGMRRIWAGKEMDKVGKDERILLSSGEDDPVGQFGKGVKWLLAQYEKRGLKNVEMKLYPHMRHEIHNEVDREKVYEDWAKFILG